MSDLPLTESQVAVINDWLSKKIESSPACRLARYRMCVLVALVGADMATDIVDRFLGDPGLDGLPWEEVVGRLCHLLGLVVGEASLPACL